METYAEIKEALGEIKKNRDHQRHKWIAHILKNLEALFGEEILEYIIVLTGNRLKYGKW
jgi:DNA polymerase III delta subunit